MKNVLRKISVVLIIFVAILGFCTIKSYAGTNDYYITVNYGSNVVTIYTKDEARKFYSSV